MNTMYVFDTGMSVRKSAFDRVIPVALALTFALVLGGCSKEQTAAPPATQTVAIEGLSEEQQPAKRPARKLVTVTKFEIAPQTVRRGQTATVTVAAHDVPPGTDLILSWFKPDGWSLTDQMIAGGNGKLEAPVAQMTEPGTYKVELRDGYIHLGEAALTLTP